MAFDYTTVPAQGGFELIPAGTTALMTLKIRPGGVGEDALLKPSNDRMSAMLDCEFKIMSGTFNGRKFWGNFLLEGTTSGHKDAIKISRGILRGIIESARAIHPKDESEQARKQRTVDLRDFQGVVFTGKIGIEKGGPVKDRIGENYPDKNYLICAIGPDRSEWQRPPHEPPPVDGGSPKAGSGSDGATPAQPKTGGGSDNDTSAQPTAPAPAIARPKWATS